MSIGETPLKKRTITKEEIVSILAKTFLKSEKEVLSAESIQDIAYQSLDKVELVCALEDHYHIKLDLEDADKLNDWESAISYLQKKVDQNKNEK